MSQSTNNHQINIAEATVEELKAAAYDQLLVLQQVQTTITALQAEIQKRADQAKPTKDS